MTISKTKIDASCDPVIPRVNNFDLIRLLAASQVAIGHFSHYFEIGGPIFGALSYFPGVPIFFLISGFLITASYANSVSKSGSLIPFYWNRVLRLVPGLWVCVLLSLAIIFVSGYQIDSSLEKIWFWAGSMFITPYYTPSFLEGYGTGSFNGSLWTVAVEIQFYLLTPIIYLLLVSYRKLFVVLFLAFVYFAAIRFDVYSSPLIQKVFEITFLPWISMFLVGAYLACSPAVYKKIMSVPFGVYVVLYALSVMLSETINLPTGNNMNALSFLFLSGVVMKLSTMDALSKFSPSADLSYGIYIIHMPIVNFLIFREVSGYWGFFLAAIVTVAYGAISWYLVERPALSLKRLALRRA